MSQTTSNTTSKKKSRTKIMLEAWLGQGKTIPQCINKGCTKSVAIRHWSAQGDPSLKTECCTCSRSRIKGKTIPGITFHKKNYCENKDCILGFKCPMDPERYGEFPSDIYDMDHKDGNHHNNVPENLITICKVCHSRKGKESGDFNSQKKSSRLHKNKKAVTLNNHQLAHNINESSRFEGEKKADTLNDHRLAHGINDSLK